MWWLSEKSFEIRFSSSLISAPYSGASWTRHNRYLWTRGEPGCWTPAKKLVQFFVIPDGQLEMVRITNYPTKLLQVVSTCPPHMHAEGPGTRLCKPMQHHAVEATCNYKKPLLCFLASFIQCHTLSS